MGLGAVLFRTGEIRSSHLGGLFKSMPGHWILYRWHSPFQFPCFVDLLVRRS